MALKIGRKKDENPTPATSTSPPSDDWSEFGPGDGRDRVPTPAPVQAAPPRASNARVWLLGLGAFALVGGALAAWQMFGGAEETEESAAPVVMPARPATAPVASATRPPRKISMPVEKNGTVAVKRVKAADAGMVPPGRPAPAIKPQSPGKPARMVPVKGVPTPIQPPDGLAGQPGQRASRSSVVVARPVANTPLTPALKAQLTALWKQGAQAKQRGDAAGARRAWQQMLKLRPGHPGIQEAIDKL